MMGVKCLSEFQQSNNIGQAYKAYLKVYNYKFIGYKN